jgi:hypothetical protein
MNIKKSTHRGEKFSGDEAIRPLGYYESLMEIVKEQGKSIGSSSGPSIEGQDILSQLLESECLKNLFSTMVAIAPARSGDADEEWNPLSQRPHIPLLAQIDPFELGAEIIALKESLDGLATFTHEMMHVALWEPFFAGLWKPKNQDQFRKFSLLAEGFCFFYTDICVCGAVRARFPDGEFAFERSSPGQARFHPIRAFKALGIEDHESILQIYLDGFSGSSTPLWQRKGGSMFAASLAQQAFDFYQGSLKYLKELYGTLSVFGCFRSFYRDFCSVSSLPSFVNSSSLKFLVNDDLKGYFQFFFKKILKNLHLLSPLEINRIRFRRMIQMRAYYTAQIQWILKHDKFITPHSRPVAPKTYQAFKLSQRDRQNLLDDVLSYRSGLKKIILLLSTDLTPDLSEAMILLGGLDRDYEKKIRHVFLKKNLWVGTRRFIAPKRAGGWIDACLSKSPIDSSFHKNPMGQDMPDLILFILESSLDSIGSMKTTTAKWRQLSSILDTIQSLRLTGSHKQRSSTTKAKAKSWMESLSHRDILALWSVPLWSFNPLENEYRELLFSYQ